jgi:hypothetical protein
VLRGVVLYGRAQYPRYIGSQYCQCLVPYITV